jgi:signal transduction histidine kinase
MSDTDAMFIAPSQEFIALCQAQIMLLTQGLKSDWSAVYLTEEVGEGWEAHLIPIVIYPQSDTDWQAETRLTIGSEIWHRIVSSIPLLSTRQLAQENPTEPSVEMKQPVADWQMMLTRDQQQMVFPLVYGEVVLGLLLARRRKRQWNQQELKEIQQIARTLALACLLDRRQRWCQGQLNQYQAMQRLERDRLDTLLHQLRNPLTALRTFSKLLLKQLLPDERERAIAQGVVRESDRLQELLQDFEADLDALTLDTETVTLSASAPALASSSLSAKTALFLPSNTLKLEAVSIPALLEPLLASAQAIAQERNIELTAHIPESLPPVQGNARALREVFSNLIDNALKYTPAGGKVEIETGLMTDSEAGQWQGTAIRDTGYGIPPEDRDHIFERRYRGVQAGGEIAGSGLGLAIARGLVEQMQGKIELSALNPLAETSTYPGTSFIVWLPLSNWT